MKASSSISGMGHSVIGVESCRTSGRWNLQVNLEYERINTLLMVTFVAASVAVKIPNCVC